MNQTAYLISDKALSIYYEARQDHQKIPLSVRWLKRSLEWAKQKHCFDLADELNAYITGLVALQEA